MDQKKSFGKKVEDFLGGKGFPLVLGVCITIIGLSAWYVARTVSPLLSANTVETVESQTPVLQQEEESFSQYVNKIQEKKQEKQEETAASSAESAEPQVSTVEQYPEEEQTTGQQETENLIPASYVWPVSGEISKEYSSEVPVFSKTLSDWRVHEGMDIASPLGTKVLAAGSGTVKEIFEDDLYGTTVIIDHGEGLLSKYCNLAAVPTVQEGDWVQAGEIIGSVGDTARAEIGEVTHLHFEMQKDGVTCDPMDYLPEK